MKTRYDIAFNNVNVRGETAFIPFAVAGDPNPETFLDVITAYVQSGADVLEIGYPFSDPVADGPVNQRASQRSIKSGAHGVIVGSALVTEIENCALKGVNPSAILKKKVKALKAGTIAA